MVTRLEHVAERRLPSPRAGGGVNHDRVASFEYLLHIGQDFQAEGAELGTTVVDGGRADGAQDAIGYGRGAWDLQEVATGRVKVGNEHG
jgi:hypothetical protein